MQAETLGVSRRAWLVLAGILAVAAVVVVIAPPEQTLGEAIKYVYVHVALTWAGMLGIYLAGLLGLAVLLTARPSWRRWAQIVGWVGLGLFVLGGLGSALASVMTWGGIAWQEPRNLLMLNAIALGLVALILAAWVPWPRVSGGLIGLFAGYVAWAIPNSPRVLHPDNPIGTSTSLAIPLTFGGLTLLAIALGVWLVWHWSRLPAHERAAAD